MTDEIGVNIEMARDGSFEPMAMATETDVAGKTEPEAAASPLPSELNPEVPDIADMPSDVATSSDGGDTTEEAANKTAKPRKNDQVLVKLANQINDAVPDLDDKCIKLGKLLLKSRDCFLDTRDGREEWKTWVRQNIHLSDSRVRELMRISKAKDPVAEKKKQSANNAKRQSAYRNKKAAALAVSAKSDSISDVKASPEPSEHEVLVEKFTAVARTWARAQTATELQRVISLIMASGDDFPEMPRFLIRGKSALTHSAPNVNGGAVT